MHDLLQEMGKNIVFDESPKNPGKRSRLWSLNDVNSVLVKNKGTEAIESIVLDLPQRYEKDDGIALTLSQGYEACLHPDAFSKTSQLKLLKLCKMQLPRGLNCLPSALKVLDWIQCPLKPLPLTDEFDELVDLKLCHSKLEQLWNGTKFLGCLKFIDMSFSKNLTRVPDISGVPNLEKLVLEGCESLFEVHPSLGLHRKLVLVNFEDCRNLKYLPGKLEMSSMEHLILSGCSKVKQLPEFGGSMLKLSSLSLEGTSIKELPLSVGCLIGLVVLMLKDCKNLCCLPSTIQNLKSLRILNISGCSKLSRLPENLQEIKSLTELNASGTAIEEVTSRILPENLEVLSFQGCKSRSWDWLMDFWSTPQDQEGFRLPHSFSAFSSLRILNLSYCNLSDGSIPGDIECLSLLLSLDLSGNNFTCLPNGISELSMLTSLRLNCCKRLRSLPELPLGIEVLDARNSTSLETFESNSSKQCSLVPWSKKYNYYRGRSFTPRRSINIAPERCRFALSGKGWIFEENNIYQENNMPRAKFHMLIPSDKIPSWFDTKNNSSSLATLRLRIPHSWPMTEWVGIAFSCILVRKDCPSKLYPNFGHRISYKMEDGLKCNAFCVSWGPPSEPIQPHLSIIYMSAEEFRDKIYKDSDCSEIEFRFQTTGDSKGMGIIGCGGRLVYEQDFEDWNKTIWSMQQ
ncbi:hypothetical protein L6164_023626 [Bauhinia variegata]|uniref:Uncharacterized protein n=1 Tax=Bauhinia variegata TaxID=167791 RepID=A0ACB9MJM8_BAUVA|nr:hypothetical protein L6164_023626 [Bauhinia variegata]